MDVLESLRGMLGDAYVRLFDAIDRNAITPEQRAHFRATDPKFRAADDIWQQQVREMEARRAPQPNELQRRVNGGMLPMQERPPRAWPSASGVRG